MKKGYYICMGSGSTSLGVEKKIEMHLVEFNKFFVTELIWVPKVERGILKKIWGLFFFVSNKFDYEQLFNKIVDPDFLFIRYPFSDKKFLYFLQRIREAYSRCKIIVEIPTYPYDKEYWDSIDIFFLIKDMLYRKKLKNYVDRFATYSVDEIIWGVPTIRMINGVVVDSIMMSRSNIKSISQRQTIRLLAVAAFQKSHGYERVIKGLAGYYRGPADRKIELYLVGNGKEVIKYKKLAKQYGVEQYIFFCGEKTGLELERIYDHMDIALGVFGLYKRKIYRSSALKIREYLAKGLPIVSGCQEDAFEQKEDYKYFLEFPNDDSVIDMQRIVDFYKSVYEADTEWEQIRREIREYARRTVDLSVTMQPVIKYICS